MLLNPQQFYVYYWLGCKLVRPQICDNVNRHIVTSLHRSTYVKTTARPAFVNLRRGRQEASKTAPIFRDPDVIAAEIVEDLEAALAQLKLARCPHSLTASLAALPSMSLIPFAPFTEIATDLKRGCS